MGMPKVILASGGMPVPDARGGGPVGATGTTAGGEAATEVVVAPDATGGTAGVVAAGVGDAAGVVVGCAMGGATTTELAWVVVGTAAGVAVVVGAGAAGVPGVLPGAWRLPKCLGFSFSPLTATAAERKSSVESFMMIV